MKATVDTSKPTLGDLLDLVVEEAMEPKPTFRKLAEAANLDPARDFVGASLRDLDMRHEDLRGFNFSKSDLTGSDFRKADVEGALFKDAKLTGVIGLPETLPDTLLGYADSIDVQKLLRRCVGEFPFPPSNAPFEVFMRNDVEAVIVQYREALIYLFRRYLASITNALRAKLEIGSSRVEIELFNPERLEKSLMVHFNERDTKLVEKRGFSSSSMMSILRFIWRATTPFEDETIRRLKKDTGIKTRTSTSSEVNVLHVSIEIPSLDRRSAAGRDFQYLRDKWDNVNFVFSKR